MASHDIEKQVVEGGKSENESANAAEVQLEDERNSTQDVEEEDVTEDILQQALAEASGGALDHIDQPPIDESAGLFPSSPAKEAAVLPNNSVSTSGSPSKGPAPPLGSKNNPIRIVQQGNTYTSMQQLSQAQIQQIVQVLQQQNIAAKGINGASTAVFNPETNTRIVYRVVQPHGSNKAGTSTAGRMTARQYHEAKYGPKAKKRQRSEVDDDEDVSSDSSKSSYEGESDSDVDDRPAKDLPELSPTEKIKKKREKPVTRSGRISKPPKHMVKDYKHIHRVDWYEDYDDDDGGYSDIYDSDHGDGDHHDANTEKRKKFGCSACEKAYIGPAGLARHFRLSGHGDPEQVYKDYPEAAPSANQSQTPATTTASELPAPDNSLTTAAPSGTPTPSTAPPKAPAGRGRPRGRPKKKPGDEVWRPPPHVKVGSTETPRPRGRPPSSGSARGPGRPPLSPAERKRRRAARLDNFLENFTSKEVLRCMATRFASDNITLYDMLVAGLGSNPPDGISYTVMLQKFMELQSKMVELAQVCLRPIAEGEQVAEDKEAIQIAAESIAQSVGVKTGYFEVSDVPRVVDSDDEEEATEVESQVDEASQSSFEVSTQLQAQMVNADQRLTTNSVATTNQIVATTVATPLTASTPSVTLQTDPTSSSQVNIASTISQSVISPHINTQSTSAVMVSPRTYGRRVVHQTPTVSTSASSAKSLINKSALAQVSLAQQQAKAVTTTQAIAHTLVEKLPQVTQTPAAVVDATSSITLQTSSAELGSTTAALTTSEDTLHALSQIMPGDVLQIEGGESFIIPEGASIVQTAEGLVIYQNTPSS